MKQRKKILKSYSRILFPYSKKNRFQESKRFMEQPSFELHDIYRSLSVIAQESDYMQSRIFKNSTTIQKRNTQIIYYNCTNFYFEIDNEGDDKQFGKSKENRSLPIIGMGCLWTVTAYPYLIELQALQCRQFIIQVSHQKISMIYTGACT